MRAPLLLLPALLMLITACGGRRSHHHHSKDTVRSRLAQRTTPRHRSKSVGIQFVDGLIWTAVEIATYEALEARQRRLLVRALRAQPTSAPPTAPNAAPLTRTQAAPRPTPRPATLTDRMGQRVELELADERVVQGELRGHTGVYAFVRDDTGVMIQVPATEIVSHAPAP